MVKVAKPTPKSFSKIKKTENTFKKKKFDNGAGGTPPVTQKKNVKMISKSLKGAVAVPAVKVNKAKETVALKKVKSKPQNDGKEKLPKLSSKAATSKASAVLVAPSKQGKNKRKINMEDNVKAAKLAFVPEASKPTPEPVPTDKIKNNSKKPLKGKKKASQSKVVLPLNSSKAKLESETTSKGKNMNKNKKQKQKQQLKSKLENKIKETKAKVERAVTYEPVPFDEEKFKSILKPGNIRKIVQSLKTLVEEEVSNKKASIFADYRYILDIACFKIGAVPKRMVKLNLKHSLVDKADDILIVVPDLKRGINIDYEPTIQHYEDIFREAGVEGLTIMPFNQLRKEYKSFESLRKLGATYDYFMCDGRLAGQITGFCGKTFQKARTTFHSVRMEKTTNLKQEIEKSLRRTAFKQFNKGNIVSIPIGSHKHTSDKLTDNIEHVISQLNELYPGSLPNIRNIYVKIDISGTSSLPLYINMSDVPPNAPFVVGPREMRMLALKSNANRALSKFALTKDANFIKLSKQLQKQKRKLKEAREFLVSKASKDIVDPSTKDEDGEDIVPAKKARKEEEKDNSGNEVKKTTNAGHDENDEEDDYETEDEEEICDAEGKLDEEDDSNTGVEEDDDVTDSDEEDEEDDEDDDGEDDDGEDDEEEEEEEI